MFILYVVALLTLAQWGAKVTKLVTLTVVFKAVRFLAVATLWLLGFLNTGLWVRIIKDLLVAHLEDLDFLNSKSTMWVILTPSAVAVLAGLASSKTLTVQLKTLSIPTVALLAGTLTGIGVVLIETLFGVDDQNILVIVKVLIILFCSWLKEVKRAVDKYQIWVHGENLQSLSF